MVRTNAVQMTSVNGLAFKQKLTSGGAGITIITVSDKAVFTINKRDGACVPFGKVDTEIFTKAVTDEALELTRGLPYRRLGAITKVYDDKHCDETPVELETDDEKIVTDIIASVEYKEFIAQYTDKNEKFSYQLMNKELMQFASKSSIVEKMLSEKADIDTIVKYVVNSKASDLAQNKGMDEATLTAFIETFDSMNTRSAFKEFKAYIRGRLSKTKK